MNLYLISQSTNGNYDTYDSAIVAAMTADEARMIHPSLGIEWDGKEDGYGCTWSDFADVEAELIGKTEINTPSVVLASFNAG